MAQQRYRRFPQRHNSISCNEVNEAIRISLALISPIRAGDIGLARAIRRLSSGTVEALRWARNRAAWVTADARLRGDVPYRCVDRLYSLNGCKIPVLGDGNLGVI
jgi:hypothetical protein